MCHKEFGLDASDEGKRLYKMFQVKNPQGKKVVNVLEILAVLILHSDFGQTNEKDLLHNSELIEHKMNLMLILFDLRDTAKVNVVEVMIMCRTVMQGFAKMYPTVKFFKCLDVMEEIRPSILSLFTEKIEEEIRLQQEQEMKSINSNLKTDIKAFAGEVDEMATPIIFSKQSSPGLGILNKNVGTGLTFSQKTAIGGKHRSLDAPDSSQSLVSGGPLGASRIQQETLIQKKNRLFKWNHF